MKIHNAIFSFALLILFLSSCLIVQAQIGPEELQQKVDSIFVDVGSSISPGSAVLVVKDQEIVLNKGYGFANLEYEIPITANTVFDLASLSKQFTGYAISLLIEQGKVSENDDIRKYIPEFPEFDQKITIRHLLHHTSGLRDWTSTLPLAGWSFDDVISFDHILRMVYQQKALNFTPGSQYTYSNAGYNILAELVQRVSGLSFRNWTDQNIFQPLEMTNTFFLDNHSEVIANRASGYFLDDNKVYNHAPNNLTALGSSSLYSTSTDLARWVTHLMHPSNELEAVVKRMFQTDTLNNGDKNSYASGISINKFRGTEWISHSGSWASFATYLVLLPSYDLSIVVLNNHRSSAYTIARQIASFYVPDSDINQKNDQSEQYKEIVLPNKLLNQYAGTYKLGTAWYVHLTTEDNQLWTQATKEDKYPMKALSDTVFLINAYGNRTMTFSKNEKDQVTHLVYNGMICPKLSNNSSTFSLSDAHNFTGEYFSEELNTSYKVILDEDQLKLWHFHNGEIKLNPAWNDEFGGSQWYANAVEFHRDDNGKITGLYISQNRARNQFFRKISIDSAGAKK